MSNIPGILSGVGVAAVGVAAASFSQTGSVSPLVIASGGIGAVFLVLGLSKKSIPRGKGGCDVTRQTQFDANTASTVTEKDEDGKDHVVYCGKKGYIGLPFKGDSVVKDEKGLVTSSSKDINTTYDLIFGITEFDERPALARCTKQHTFKDAMKDGKPNPKPMVIDVAASWESLTYKEVKTQARAFGTCLRKTFSLAQREKVAIWSANCVEWMVADMACAAYNFTSVSVYDTLGPDAASYIVADSGAQVLVCEDKCFKRVPALLDDAVYRDNKGADLQVVVYMGKGDAATQAAIEAKGVKVYSFNESIKENINGLLEDTKPEPKDIVTIMYTSGTTGMPKGVMLSHLNITATICMIDLSPSIGLLPTDIHLSYLPLAHIFERQNCMGLLFKGAVIYFASNGSKALLADLSVVRPTLFAGVPKVYENVRDAVKRKMTGFKLTLFEAAMAAKVADLQSGCGYSPIWDLLVFSKTKKALGGRVRFCVTGGAPISKDTLEFVLCALGPVVQGYGATETSAASTLTMSFDLAMGHVGPPLGTAAIRLVDVPHMNYFSGTAADYKDGKGKAAFAAGKNKSGGEVWIGGPGVSLGYFDPSVNGLKKGIPSNGMSKKTEEEFFEEDGWSWFKTGDVGTWTENGCLKIVDRKKNLFKTSLGEYVPVEEVEKVYQDSCEMADFVYVPKETKVSYIALCVVVSDSIGTVMKWAKENGVAGDEKTVCSSDKFKQKLAEMFEEAAKAKKLQRFMWVNKKNIHSEYLPIGYQEEWVAGVQCANGQKEQLLTATFKARRSQLDQFFAPVFKTIYPDRPADHILP
jgi:long-chain acyl-CoA synthetase